MALFVVEVVMRPAQRSSRASHGRQRREMAARDWECAVGSLGKPCWWIAPKVAMCLSMKFSVDVSARYRCSSRVLLERETQTDVFVGDVGVVIQHA